ncbi:MAG: hypothetical protein O3A01_06915 [bacterium]|nr:hypothetical protein [bacterium]
MIAISLKLTLTLCVLPLILSSLLYWNSARLTQQWAAHIATNQNIIQGKQRSKNQTKASTLRNCKANFQECNAQDNTFNVRHNKPNELSNMISWARNHHAKHFRIHNKKGVLHAKIEF